MGISMSINFFDHSSGHDCLRPDSLNVKEINKFYGGKKEMHSSEIKNADTYLGPHSPILQQGDIQHMNFRPGDTGPFYLSDEERTATKWCCQSDEVVSKKYTKNELRKKIFELTSMDPAPNTNLKKMRELATKNNIPIEYEMKKVKEGWMGKPKGMLQILRERGFIDFEGKEMKAVVSYYTVDGRKINDSENDIIEGTSLRQLIKNLPDFKEELTLLQFRAKQLGVSLVCSPKYHPEIAGEGIEYAWGCSKNAYRRYSIKEKKKSKERFCELVSDAINLQENMTPV